MREGEHTVFWQRGSQRVPTVTCARRRWEKQVGLQGASWGGRPGKVGAFQAGEAAAHERGKSCCWWRQVDRDAEGQNPQSGGWWVAAAATSEAGQEAAGPLQLLLPLCRQVCSSQLEAYFHDQFH